MSAHVTRTGWAICSNRSLVGGTAAMWRKLICCRSWKGLISPEWTIGELEEVRAEGQEGVRVQGEKVLVNSGVMYDILREL